MNKTELIKKFGHRLLTRVDIEIGGHVEKRYYCDYCRTCYDQQKPDVCNKFVYSLEKYERFCEDKGFNEDQKLHAQKEYYDDMKIICPSTKFSFRSCEGSVIDRHYGEWIDISKP
jgi:hypothetical protein